MMREMTPDERATALRHVRVEQLIAALAGPTFRYRMAHGPCDLSRYGHGGPFTTKEKARRRSALTRRTNAERDVEKIVLDWVAEHFDRRTAE